MNHCRDCNSDYATPGTCNCFALGGKRYVSPAPTITPWVPIYPGTSPYPTWIPYTPQIPQYPLTTTSPTTGTFTLWNNLGGGSC